MKITRPEKPEDISSLGLAQNDDDFICILLINILRDAFNNLPTYGSADYIRDVHTVYDRMLNEGIGFATKVLPQFFNDLMMLIESGESSFLGFKKWKRRSQLPAFLHVLTDMIVNRLSGHTDALRVIYMLCSAFKKLKGPYDNAILSEQLDKFIADDESLLSHNYFQDSYTSGIMHRARQIINTLFKHVDCGSFMPKPGSGATNTPLKYHMRFEPHVIYSQLAEVFPYGSWFYYGPNAFAVNMFNGFLKLQEEEYPTSRLKYVHKYVGKPRGICIEENETQYLQQGIKNTMYKLIESHPMTKGRINFTSQNINRELALRSSADKSFCTIDMSAASDMISRDLVFQLFRDTDLLPFLDAVSTRIIKFPKEVRQGSMLSHKFAPMGSAVCFPVMAVVHYALCRAIIEKCQIENTRNESREVYVYGDDILLPAKFTEEIFRILPKFGMRLNKEKSFFRSNFRESCGLHAYDGCEVTPVYNNYTLNVNHERNDSTRLLSVLSKEASYHNSGYSATADVLRKHIRHVYGQIPYGSPTSSLLCFKRCSVYNVFWQKAMARDRRWNDDLQCYEYRVRVCVPKYTDHDLTQDAAYLRWFLTRSEESSTFMEYDEQKIVHRWVLDSDLG